MRSFVGRVVGLLFLMGSASASAADVAERSKGDPEAPVTMIEYASLTCPHCASFHTEILPGIEERYIDTGKVRLIMRDFPLDQVALAASVIAHCAGEERYFQFIDALFTSQEQWARASDPAEALLQLAQLGGLPKEEARACLDDQAMGEAVLQMRLDAQEAFEIRSTPSFVINGTLYTGSRSVDDFAEIFDPLID